MSVSTDARICFVCAILLAVTSPEGRAQTREELLPKFSEGSHTYNSPYGDVITRPFRLFVPDNYDQEKKYPIVLALHGRGAWGDDNWKQILWDDAAVAWADTATQKLHPAFIIAPQAPPSYGNPYFFPGNGAGHSLSLLDSLLTVYAIDPDRIYITGLSMGGFGTWETITQRPEFFAAAIPMSGASWNTFDAPALVDLPIWAFHGEADGGVSPETTRQWFREFELLGLSPAYTDCQLDGTCEVSTECSRSRASFNRRHIYTELKGQGHVIWGPMYADPVLIEWVFAQRRGNQTLGKVGSAVMMDVDATSIVAEHPQRLVGLVGDRYPLNWDTPMALCAEINSEIFGGLIEFPDTTVGTLNYRFVHYDESFQDIVHESRLGGDRAVTLEGSALSVPILFWNDEDQRLPSPVTFFYPAHGATTPPDLRLIWTIGAVGGRYEFELDSLPAFASPMLSVGDLRQPSWRVETLDTLATYFWRARATNAAGSSGWTTGEFFTLGTQPQLLDPPDGATDQAGNVILRWRPYLDATIYMVVVSENALFEGASSTLVRDATHLQVNDLDPGTRYYWRVRRRAITAVPSPVWSFTTASSTAVSDRPEPHSFQLYSSYPNPFRTSTLLKFSIPSASDVSISVFDLVGREVWKTRLNATSAGDHEIIFDGHGLSSGMYYYRVEAGGASETSRIVKIK